MSQLTNVLSIDEIKINAEKFSKEHKKDNYEIGEAQTFLNDFFKVFGIKRKDVARFEVHPNPKDKDRMDLFWPKKLLVEMKSKGRNIDQAMDEAFEYYKDLPQDDEPQYLLACDFQKWYLRDKKDNTDYFFKLSELSENIELFNFMINRPKVIQTDPVNIKATEMMGLIFDALAASGYGSSRQVEYFLTRLVFCLFADDSGIFQNRGMFQKFIEENTKKDGSDLGLYIAALFANLNEKDERKRLRVANEFPYINGALFSETIEFPDFNEKLRLLLIEAGTYDWSKVSPAIFGSLFQTVMDPEARRQEGAHYTSEEYILKVITPLILDDLNDEFNAICEIRNDTRKERFLEFQNKLSNLTFLDPACGSGNFLAITYREIRRIELRVIMKIYGYEGKRTDTDNLSKIDVHQFYGIEKDSFSSKIAEISLWMMDHLMNLELTARFGWRFRRIPIQKQPHIHCRDALEVDWEKILPSTKCSYVLGNPPYAGSKVQTDEQREQTKRIANLGGSGGTLDYVSGWLIKAAEYVQEETPIGFVTTNSITQGEQVGQLWPIIFEKGLNINFAYDSFKWESESRGTASVYVVILGISKKNLQEKRLFYNTVNGIIEKNSSHISPYLVLGSEPLSIVKESSNPLNGLPRIGMGSQPIDGGHYIFTDNEKSEFLDKEPHAKSFFRPFVGAREFLYGEIRWILKLHDIKPNELQNLPEIKKRMKLVREYRLRSISKVTRKLAESPTLYNHNVIPTDPFLVVPEVSSERREYVPLAYMQPPTIPSNLVKIIPNANLMLFGLLTSKMHMIWLRTVGGRLKLDLRYSAGIVYNTFPVPEGKFDSLESYAKKILEMRERYPESTLADLYDPISMPVDLKKAHQNLDDAVDKLYRKEPFETDYARIEHLLIRYKKMTSKNQTLH